MKTSLRIASLTLLVLALVAGCKSAGQRRPDHEPSTQAKNAYLQLLSIKCFAFGGVGYAGRMSNGEHCFRTIAADPNQLAIFRTVLENGTTEAQLYALYGIHVYAPAEFDTAAAPIIAANKKVFQMTGCMGGNEYATNIVARIASGSYGHYLNAPW